MARKLASEYYFIIHENKRTEIILLFDKQDDNIDFDEFNTSLKIIEVFSVEIVKDIRSFDNPNIAPAFDTDLKIA